MIRCIVKIDTWRDKKKEEKKKKEEEKKEKRKWFVCLSVLFALPTLTELNNFFLFHWVTSTLVPSLRLSSILSVLSTSFSSNRDLAHVAVLSAEKSGGKANECFHRIFPPSSLLILHSPLHSHLLSTQLRLKTNQTAEQLARGLHPSLWPWLVTLTQFLQLGRRRWEGAVTLKSGRQGRGVQHERHETLRRGRWVRSVGEADLTSSGSRVDRFLYPGWELWWDVWNEAKKAIVSQSVRDSNLRLLWRIDCFLVFNIRSTGKVMSGRTQVTRWQIQSDPRLRMHNTLCIGRYDLNKPPYLWRNCVNVCQGSSLWLQRPFHVLGSVAHMRSSPHRLAQKTRRSVH